ncbi:hypothetical protein [Comamonas sp.]|nr:hypothetical protein [Comamonas sp.]
MNTNSPLEQLAAFAVCFALGAASAVTLAVYTKCVSKKAST